MGFLSMFRGVKMNNISSPTFLINSQFNTKEWHKGILIHSFYMKHGVVYAITNILNTVINLSRWDI